MPEKAKTRKHRNPRSKQPYLHPDMEPPHIPEIDIAADEYYEAMENRQKFLKDEVACKENLLTKMKNNGQTRYKTPDGLIVVVLSKDVIKCKKKKDKELTLNGDS